MKLAFSALLISTALAVPLVAQSATANPDTPPSPMQPGMHGARGFGPGFRPGRFGPMMAAHRAEPITNSPFVARFAETADFTTREGKQQQRSTTSVLYRDSQGRIREEITLPPPPPRPADAAANAGSTSAASATPVAPRTEIVILDPVPHTITRLNPQKKTAMVETVPENFFKRVQQHDERRAAGQGSPRDDNSVQHTDLGNKVIAGVPAKGERSTHTLPAREGGTAETRTHEAWYSPDAKFEVSSSETGGRMSHTDTLTSFSKVEPDAALFKVPADYTTRTAAEHGFGRGWHHGPDGPGGPGGPDTPPPPPPPAQ